MVLNHFNDLAIIIPSSNRASVSRQTTLKQFPEHIQNRISLAVPVNQCNDYHAIHGNLLLVPKEYKGISKTRQFLIENTEKRFLLMLDDDMTFAVRPIMSQPKLKSIAPGSSEIVNMISFWRDLCRRFVHVGLSARQGNNRVSKEISLCARMFNAYMYDLVKFGNIKGIKLGRIEVMEDFDLTLQLLKRGYPNAIIYRWCWNQAGSNTSGGCSDYRTAQVQADAAHRLAKLHPGLVKVVTKQSKNWKDMEERVDVIISWKKALSYV